MLKGSKHQIPSSSERTVGPWQATRWLPAVLRATGWKRPKISKSRSVEEHLQPVRVQYILLCVRPGANISCWLFSFHHSLKQGEPPGCIPAAGRGFSAPRRANLACETAWLQVSAIEVLADTQRVNKWKLQYHLIHLFLEKCLLLT